MIELFTKAMDNGSLVAEKSDLYQKAYLYQRKELADAEAEIETEDMKKST